MLTKNGLLLFRVRSTNDSFYGKGKEIEKDYFELKGHKRHFFSEKYIKELCQNLFTIINAEETIGEHFFSNKLATRKTHFIDAVLQLK